MLVSASLELEPSQNLNEDNPQRISLSTQKVVLGRASSSDIVLNLKGIGDGPGGSNLSNIISRKHAEIIMCGSMEMPRWKVKDHKSVNGVFVNGIKVAEKELHDGDILQFGGASTLPYGAKLIGSQASIRYRFKGPLSKSNKRRRTLSTESKESTASRDSSIQKPIKVRRRTNSKNQLVSQDEEIQKLKKNTVALHDEITMLKKLLSRAQDKISAAEHAKIKAEKPMQSRTQMDANVQTDPMVDNDLQSMKMARERLSSLLMPEIMCALCSEVMYDASVVPCSHGFCRSCWDLHIKEIGRSECPICMWRFHSIDRPRRSMHLQNLASIIVAEFGSAAQQHSMEMREAEDSRCPQESPTESRLSSNGTWITNRTSEVQEHQSKSINSNPPVTILFCEGCNEIGHDMKACPHRSDDALHESSEDEDFYGL